MTRHGLARVPAILAVVALAACTHAIPEFQQYEVAFDAQSAQGTLVLDRLAKAEHEVDQRRRAKVKGIPPFDPESARYDAGIGDPPLTGAIRESLAAVANYNAALSGLASGEATAALSARMGLAANSATQVAGIVALVGGASAAFVPAAEAVIQSLLPLFAQLSAIEDRAAFREQLLAAFPDVRALLLAIRNEGTPEMFEMMKRSLVERGSLGGSVDGVPKKNLPQLERDRRTLSGWVVLIDKTLVAMDAAVAAAQSGGVQADVSALTAASAELNVLAELLRSVRFRE